MNLNTFSGIGSSCRKPLLTFLLLVFLYSGSLWAQTIPANRLSDWSTAGLTLSNIPVTQTMNFSEFGGVGDGITPNDLAFTNLIYGLSEGLTELFFPEGTYLFNSALQLPENVLLRGAGSGLTKLLFNLEDEMSHLILVAGTAGSQSVPLLQDALRGEELVAVTSGASFEVGDFIMLLDVDSAMVTSDWAIGSTGQLNRVNDIIGNLLFLDSPIRRDFLAGNQGEVIKYQPIKNVGIESLSIERQDSSSYQTSNIMFNYAANCWIKCVESYRCNFAHVELRNSTNVSISGSYFQDAFHYGNGGKAYGVMMHFASGENLVYNNTFLHLRHSMILQAGANGNVFAYNYSIEPYWTEVSLPANSAGDMVLHGNYPYANLFEGNICQNIVIDDSHGINGPYNTFFRNRSEHYGIFMNFVDPSHQQNFIGNEISNMSQALGFYILFGTDHHEQGNNLKGIKLPEESIDPTEKSLFLDTIPAFYQSQNWPPIGFPNSLNSYSIEAKERYAEGVHTACEEEPEPEITSVDEIEELVTMLIYPNPVRDVLNIYVDEGEAIGRLKVYSQLGVILFEKENNPHSYDSAQNNSKLDVRGLPDGSYVLEIELMSTERLYARFIKGK